MRSRLEETWRLQEKLHESILELPIVRTRRHANVLALMLVGLLSACTCDSTQELLGYQSGSSVNEITIDARAEGFEVALIEKSTIVTTPYEVLELMRDGRAVKRLHFIEHQLFEVWHFETSAKAGGTSIDYLGRRYRSELDSCREKRFQTAVSKT